MIADETAQVRQIWSTLGLPGVIDVHTHFMPKSVLDKVWNYFDSAGPLVGRPWPIAYRDNESQRVNTLRRFGVRRFTALVYPHKPRMAAWLNQWSAQFARHTPDCLATATFYPELGATEYVEKAIREVPVSSRRTSRSAATTPMIRCLTGFGESLRTRVYRSSSTAGRARHQANTPARTDRPPAAPLPATAVDHCAHGNAGIRRVFRHLRAPSRGHAGHHDGLHPFAEETMPFPPSQWHRLGQLGDRIVFGSDFPNIPYAYSEAMRSLTRLPGVDDGWLRGVFYENAARLFDGVPR
ncbi:amidohydrolase family protein [Mycobacterium xenopi 4042]|uniref:Amidohydrolase family protein n=1 Tax=Mycobacterium xenopi 4042 TaxID=1299334 RepID=X7ZAQ2_MYCXE|nr:amidohydrolase family protein [Mycobacterium xenopi 4042]